MAGPVADDLTGRILGDFEIVRPIGRGGMGIVYEARQISLKRTVALKVLGGGLGLTHRAVTRFRREAEAAARLHHTNIVPVYATGEDQGTHFYAMELIAGPSLDHVLDRLRKDRAGSVTAPDPGSNGDPPGASETLPPWVSETIDFRPVATPRTPSQPVEGSSLDAGGGYFDRVAGRIADVADALDYAHQNGVIHRDIKPSNLLLSPDGRLSINDFGLARMLEEPGMTMTGEFVGTPKYMSPEQITAGRAPLDHRTDIYSLGATLYELLTLCPPYAGNRRDEVIGQIIHKEPTPPRRLDRRIPVDLETICLKAMDKDPDRRYQTAGEMAEDLRRYVNRYAIAARRASPLTRAKKWVRRNPALAAALGCVLMAVVAAGAFALQARREREQRDLERILSAREAERQREEHHREQIRQLFTQAYEYCLDGRLEEAKSAVEKAELLGASTGVVRLLNGMISFHSGNPDGAHDDLEQAVKLLHREDDAEWLIRARSLRAFIKALSGEGEEYFEEIDWLLSQPRLTPDEKFYIGCAVGLFDPRKGCELMEEFLAKYPTDLVASRTGAAGRAHLAVDTGRPADIEEALHSLGGVVSFLPDSPYTMLYVAFDNFLAARIYQERGRSEWADKREKADAAIKRLEDRVPNRDYTWLLRANYFDLLGETEKELETLSEGHRRMPAARRITIMYAMALYFAGKRKQALGILEGAAEAQPTLTVDLPRAFLLAEAGRRDKAIELADALSRRRPAGLDPLFAPTVLLLRGDIKVARTMWRDYRGVGPPLPLLRREFFRTLLDYCCGDLDGGEATLLAAAGASRCNRCEAHFFIAMTKLAEGEREEAKAHFREARDTQVTFLGDSLICDLSRSLLSRMKADPAWPPWIKASPKP